MLEDAWIKLSVIASGLTTVSARAMLGAVIAGEGDPAVLTDLAKARCAPRSRPGRGADRAIRRRPRPAGPLHP
jgi:hypothetical protein